MATAPLMRAVVQPRYGDDTVLALEHRPLPEVGPGQVRIRAHAASLNFGDRAMLQGLPRVFRPLYFFPGPDGRVVGHDVAGVVDAVGSGVTRFAPGDRVFGELSRGSCADFVLASEDEIARLPDGVDFVSGCTLPVAAVTALQGLRDSGGVQPGHRVLINGASGSVGTMAVQIARSMGARVTAVCSTRNLEQARSLGAEHVIDYTEQAYPTLGPTFDVILDLVGNHPLAARRAALSPGGVYVASFGQGGGAWLGPLGRILQVATAGLMSSGLKVLASNSKVQADLLEVARLVECGELRPTIAGSYPLEQTAEAFGELLGGHASGKLVIRIVD